MQLLAAVNSGPVSVAIEADSSDFQYYQWGVMNGPFCGTNLDHAVTVVGFDISDGIDDGYYIVRNSWSEQWGEQGYFRVAIVDGEGVCGIQMDPIYPETD
jgi:C1A family cysteine protease